jgi:hypothetical protein
MSEKHPGRDEKLFPTPTRMKRLRAVAEGRVWRQRLFDSNETIALERTTDHGERAVTAVVNQFVTAGWVYQGVATGPSMYARRPIEITEEGSRVLRTYGGTDG